MVRFSEFSDDEMKPVGDTESPIEDMDSNMLDVSYSDAILTTSSSSLSATHDEEDDPCTQTQELDTDMTQSSESVLSPSEGTEIPPRCMSCLPDCLSGPTKFARMNETGGVPLFNKRTTQSMYELPCPTCESSVEISKHHQYRVDSVVYPTTCTPCGRFVMISVHTANQILTGKIPLPAGYKLLVFDARFAYEYDGGHIIGARRFSIPGFRSELEELIRNARVNDERYIVLCYCQFSSKRAPKLREIFFAAEADIKFRERRNVELLTHEESRFHLFIIEGGYARFFENYPESCQPRGYVQEFDDLDQRKVIRKQYEAYVSGACACDVLKPSPVRPSMSDLRRSPSAPNFLRRSRDLFDSENIDSSNAQSDSHDDDKRYCCITDDEDDSDGGNRRRVTLDKVAKPSFDDI